jgi:malonyl CoA-acyl carrier protein transacylase
MREPIAIIATEYQDILGRDLAEYWRNVLHHPDPRGALPEDVHSWMLCDRVCDGLMAGLPLFNRQHKIGAAIASDPFLCSRITDRLQCLGPVRAFSDSDRSLFPALRFAIEMLHDRLCDVALVGYVKDCALLLACQRLADAQADGHQPLAILRAFHHNTSTLAGACASTEVGPESSGDAGDALTDITRLWLVENNADVATINRIARVSERSLVDWPNCALTVYERRESFSQSLGRLPLLDAILELWQKTISAEGEAQSRARVEALPHPFYRNTRTRPWIHGDKTRRRGMMVVTQENTFSTVLLEDVPDDPRSLHFARRQWPAELVLMSARDLESLRLRLDEALDLLSRKRGSFYETVFAIARPDETAANATQYRLAFVAMDQEELRHKLIASREAIARMQSGLASPSADIYLADGGRGAREDRAVAFLFPGQGSQHAGMFEELSVFLPRFRVLYDEFDTTAQRLGLSAPSAYLFPPPGVDEETQNLIREEMHMLIGGGIGALVGSLASYEMFRELGVEPDAIVGHSNGENAALVVSRISNYPDRTFFESLLSFRRASLNHADEERSGVALAVSGINLQELESYVSEFSDLYISMDNCPHQVVVFGPKVSIQKLSGLLQQTQAIIFRLPQLKGYHTPFFQAGARLIETLYDSVSFKAGKIPVFSCCTTERFPSEPSRIREVATQQWTRRVRFRGTIERLYAEGVRQFIEVGPGSKLTGFVRDILRGRPHLAVSATHETRDQLRHWLETLGRLYVAGFPIRSPVAAEVGGVAAEHSTQLNTRSEARAVKSAESFNEAQAEILQHHFALMDNFTEAELAVSSEFNGFMRALPGRAHNAPHPLFTNSLGRIIERDVRRLYAERVFNVNDDVYLRDHVVGQPAGQNKIAQFGLPVIPFTFSLELVAQGALACLDERYIVSSISDIRAHRWLAPDDETLKVGILAELVDDTTQAPEVRVRLFHVTDKLKSIAFEALVCLGRRRLEARTRRLTIDWNEPSLDGSLVYKNLLFHGASLQPLRRIRFKPGGKVEALCEVPQGAAGEEILPVALLDGAAQLMFLWLNEEGHKNFRIFPYYLKRLLPLIAAPSSGTRLLCRGQMHYDETKVTGDFEFISESGAIAYSLEEFTQRYFNLPGAYAECVFGDSDSMFISEQWCLPGAPLAAQVFQDFSATFLDQSWGIWRRLLARRVLGPLELSFTQQLPERDKEQSMWLIRQCVAKEAVRRWLAEQHHLSPCRNEIQILGDLRGQHTILCPKLESAGCLPQIALATSESTVVAIAAPPEATIGVALRSIWRATDADFDLAFEGDERRVSHARSSAYLLSLLCAKEAAAKALHLPLPTGLRQCCIEEVNLDQGLVVVSHKRNALPVRVGFWGDVVASVCLI